METCNMCIIGLWKILDVVAICEGGKTERRCNDIDISMRGPWQVFILSTYTYLKPTVFYDPIDALSQIFIDRFATLYSKYKYM